MKVTHTVSFWIKYTGSDYVDGRNAQKKYSEIDKRISKKFTFVTVHDNVRNCRIELNLDSNSDNLASGSKDLAQAFDRVIKHFKRLKDIKIIENGDQA